MHDHDNIDKDIADLHQKEKQTDESSLEYLTGPATPGEKIVIGGADDPSENEAKNVSDRLMNGEDAGGGFPNGSDSNGKPQAESAFTSLLSTTVNDGNLLPDSIRSGMESGMNTNLGNVKVHADSKSEALNSMLDSKAFTLGKSVFFAKDEYQPQTSVGKHLLAHELVHTQQSGHNVVRMANDDELERLREHNNKPVVPDDKSKLKAEKQLELDSFINEQGGAQSGDLLRGEMKRQRGLVHSKNELSDLDEKLKKLRNTYVRKLREGGIQPEVVGDPFAPLKPGIVDREKYFKKFVALFELYDAQVAEYNVHNEAIKDDREKILSKDADKQKMFEEFGLKLTGVQPGKTVDPRSPQERADELLLWALAEARTFDRDYTVLVREKEKKERDEKLGHKKDEYDPFISARTIIRDDLGGDRTVLTVADLQLVLRYFLKGTLTEDDKFSLVAFLSKHINSKNIEAVFGYSEDAASQIIDPSDLIKVLESYSLLNYERLPYYSKKYKGSNTFLDLERVRSLMVTRLKDMKAAKDANDAKAKNGTLTKNNKSYTGLQESYSTSGSSLFGSMYMSNVSKMKPITLFPQSLFPTMAHIAASKLQKAINEYDAASPTPAISTLQPAAWEYYQSLYPFPNTPPLSQSDFYALNNTRAEIQFLVSKNVNPVELSGGKFKTTADSYTELGTELFKVAFQTGIDYLQLKERVDYFKATDPTGYKIALGSIGATALLLSIVDKATHPKASWGQTLLPLGSLGLGGSNTLVDNKIPRYGETVSNKLTFDWDTKRDDAPPGVGLFNSMYNPSNTHPFFKGSNSVPGLFLNTGLTGTHGTTKMDGKEKDKWNYNLKLTIHYAPGSEGTTASEETVMGRVGMFFQNPFDSDQANTLMNNSPKNDMLNMWARGGASYKRNWFTMSGALGAGTFNVGGPGNQRMNAMDYKFNVGIDKLKLGDFSVGANAGISGSYADSPTVTSPLTPSTFSAKASVAWKTFSLNLSFDDDLTKPAVYNKYKAEFEYAGLGRYSPLVLKAIFMNMYNQGQDQMVFSGGLAVGFRIGTGGSGSKLQRYKFD